MKIEWLKDFLCLADAGSFSRAADLSHTAQSAFSRRIQALEEWVGAPLFDRSSAPVHLTSAGVILKPVAEEIIRSLVGVKGQIHADVAGGMRTISFAATHSLSLSYFPKLVHAAQRVMDRFDTRLFSGGVQTCFDAFIRGEYQFLLRHAHPQDGFEYDGTKILQQRVGVDTIIPVSSPDSRGRPRFHLSRSGGKEIPLLMYSSRSAVGRAVHARIRKHIGDISLKPHVESRLSGVLATMAREGGGLAWLPRSIIEDDLKSGVLVRAEDPSWDVDVEIHLFRWRAGLSKVAEEFWDAVKQIEK